MPSPSVRLPAGARSGRNALGRFVLQWEAKDGLDPLGRLLARTGQVIPFSRGGTVGAAMVLDANGLYRLAGAQEPRFAHRYNPTTGVIEFDGLSLEGQRQNVAPGSNLFADGTYWAVSSFASFTAKRSCITGQTSYMHTDTAGGSHGRSQNIGTFVNGQTDCLWAIVENVNAAGTSLSIFDVSAGAHVNLADLDWATKSAAIGGGAGATGAINLGTGPNGGQMILFWATATGTAAGTAAAGHTRAAICYVCGRASQTSSVILHHMQLEPGALFPSSPIITGAASVTRSTDAPLAIPLNVTPAQIDAAGGLTVYVDAVDLGSQANKAGVVLIGTTGFTDPWAALPDHSSTTTATFSITNNAGTRANSGSVTTGIVRGDRAETRGVIRAASALWTVEGGVSVNAAAELPAAVSSSIASPSSFSAQTAYLAFANSAAAFVNVRSIRAALGPQTLAYVRAG